VTTATAVLADIFIMFLAAKLAGEVFERLKQPAVIGELLVGVLGGHGRARWASRARLRRRCCRAVTSIFLRC
jgi:Kef-type K+ transport system membrane component KefB